LYFTVFTVSFNRKILKLDKIEQHTNNVIMFENVNWATFIAASGAVIVGIISIFISYHLNRKTNFINVVTSERIRWMGNLRESISTLCGLTYHWTITQIDPVENQQILKEIDRLRMLVKLQLNPYEPEHKDIINLVDEIPNFTCPKQKDELHKILNEIVTKNQSLLKDVWELVKKEAKEGDLTKEQEVYPWMQ
jgi:hypothetical protein